MDAKINVNKWQYLQFQLEEVYLDEGKQDFKVIFRSIRFLWLTPGWSWAMSLRTMILQNDDQEIFI